MLVSELLTDETRWTKGTYAKDASGNEVNENSPNATCWCLSGAIHKCYGEELTQDIKRTIYTIRPGITNIAAWNDNSKRTFDEIKALVIALEI